MLDGDLQDPPEIVPELVERWRNGYDVVYAVRQHRKEGPLKRLAYYVFYRLLRSISDIDIPLDSGDFCLMDRRVVHTLGRLPERIRFIRGLRTFVGFRQIGLIYEREARHVGQSKYSLGALIQLAIDGLVSFSGRPLRLISYIGAVTTMIAIILGVWVIVDAFVRSNSPSRLGEPACCGFIHELGSTHLPGNHRRVHPAHLPGGKGTTRRTLSTRSRVAGLFPPKTRKQALHRALPIERLIRRRRGGSLSHDHKMVRGRCGCEYG